MIENERKSQTFSGGTKVVNEITGFVLDGIKDLTMDEKIENSIELAVGEAIENIVEHAYQGKGGEIAVSFYSENGNLVIKIHDRGRPFDPAAVKEYKPEEQLENPGSRGRGIYIMRKCLDTVSYEFTPDGNTLTLVKKLK